MKFVSETLGRRMALQSSGIPLELHASHNAHSSSSNPNTITASFTVQPDQKGDANGDIVRAYLLHAASVTALLDALKADINALSYTEDLDKVVLSQ